jgi:nickel superoxide dismutase
MKHKLIQTMTAQAHCDVPCGIYDPTPAKIAAKTVHRMLLQLKDFHEPADWKDQAAVVQYVGAVARRIAVKEEHAQLCKKELSILWSDFFKDEHLAKFPNLHDLFWKAMKLCSKNKQEMNEEAAKQLIDQVDAIAKIFYEAKGDPARYDAYKAITDKLF